MATSGRCSFDRATTRNERIVERMHGGTNTEGSSTASTQLHALKPALQPTVLLRPSRHHCLVANRVVEAQALGSLCCPYCHRTREASCGTYPSVDRENSHRQNCSRKCATVAAQLRSFA